MKQKYLNIVLSVSVQQKSVLMEVHVKKNKNENGTECPTDRRKDSNKNSNPTRTHRI